jgi:CheY-like chemotaxis protein/PAS domain-containing protein
MSEAETPFAPIKLICQPDGVIVAATHPLPGETPGDWSSGSAGASIVGVALAKTYWFDHIDCDLRELQQVLRRAGRGEPDRARVWIRLSDHELVRADLTATPLSGETGAVSTLLVDLAPTSGPARPKDPAPTEDVGSIADIAATNRSDDLLSLRISVPLIRLDRSEGTLRQANVAAIDLLGIGPDDVAGRSMLDLFEPTDAKPVQDFLAAIHSGATSVDPVEVRLASGPDRLVKLSLADDPPAPDADATLVFLRDVTSERLMRTLMQNADLISDLSRRQTEQLQLMDAFFDQAPIGMALYSSSGLLRRNDLYDAAVSDPDTRLAFRLNLPDGVERSGFILLPEPQPTEIHKPRVLVVEDHESTQRVITRHLDAAGFDVLTAASATSARDQLRDGRIDLLICDLTLPDGDAIELMTDARIGRDLAGIALCSAAIEPEHERLRRAGFIETLSKPVVVDELELTVRRTLGLLYP